MQTHTHYCVTLLCYGDKCIDHYTLNALFFPPSFPPCVRRWGSEFWTGESLLIYNFIFLHFVLSNSQEYNEFCNMYLYISRKLVSCRQQLVFFILCLFTFSHDLSVDLRTLIGHRRYWHPREVLVIQNYRKLWFQERVHILRQNAAIGSFLRF